MADDVLEFRLTTQKTFTQAQVQALFASANKHAASYPIRLYRALMGASYVLTAWDGDTLAGLIWAIDDGELTACIQYTLVAPAYKGAGVAEQLLAATKDHYKEYLHLDAMLAEGDEFSAFQQNGFQKREDVTPFRAVNLDESLKY